MRRSKFESSMLIIRALRNSKEGLHADRIRVKANVNSCLLKTYLDFLEKEGFIGSRPAEKNYINIKSGQPKKIYYVLETGYRFESEWEKYKMRHSVDDIKNLLQSIV
jgi:predicted transcriptional regulator